MSVVASLPPRTPSEDGEKDLEIASNPDFSDPTKLRRAFTYEDAQRLKRKADWRLLPLLIAAYLIKNMDQNSISYVKTMNTGSSTNILSMLNMTSDDYAWTSTCYSITFILFEIPSNMMIKWSSPRVHFFRILMVWSVFCACTAACANMTGLLVCRTLLGVAEAGFYPGIIFHLTCWYRADEIATRMALLGLLGQFANILCAFLTYGLSFVSGRGMAGWQWTFVICGLIGFVIGAWLWFYLPDFPDSPPSRRQFFTPEEGAFMSARLPGNSARSSDKDLDWDAVRKELKSPLLYGYSFLQLCFNSSATGLAFWLPTIIQGFGLTSTANSQLLAIPPAVLYIIASILGGLYLDKTSRFPTPIWVFFGCIGLIGSFLGMIFCESKAGLYALILVAYCFEAIGFSPVQPLRTQSLKGSSAAAFSFAFQNAAAQIPRLYTAQFFLSKYAPRYQIPFTVCIVFSVGVMIFTAIVWYLQRDLEVETRRIARLRREAGKKNEILEEDVRY